MSRRTWIITGVTVAVVLICGWLLYGYEPVPPATVEAVDAPKGAKVKAPARRTAQERTVLRPIPTDRPVPPEGAPNVVVFVMSSQRRDQWTPYGAHPDIAPFLASKVKEGVVMADAIAAAVDCGPALAAIVTGRHPHALGMMDARPKDGRIGIAGEALTLAERFAAAGWRTIGATASHELNRSHGGAQGFDMYLEAQEASLTPGQRVLAKEVVDFAIERVKAGAPELKARPVYLQLVTSDSHKPLIKIDPEETATFPDGEHPELTPYRATIRRQDDALRALVEGLAQEGITEQNTVFVVLADHGEGLKVPPRHRLQHGLVLYESSASVPWMWWGRGIPRGKPVDGLASTLDLAPTLLALAGLPPEGTDGMDLSAQVKAGRKSPRSEAYSDTLLEGFHRASVWTLGRQCQRDYGSVNPPDDDDFVSGCFDRETDPEFATPIEDPDLSRRLDEIHAERIASLPAR
jgi:arylsulfatase A-like enzyme